MESLVKILKACLIAMGIGIIGYAGWEADKGVASTNWPVVKAHVDDTAVEHFTDKWGQQHDQPKVKYSYTVNGKTYHGDRIQFGGSLSAKSDAHKDVLAPFRRSELAVRYDPGNPELSCLLPGPDWMTVGIMVVIGLLCIFNDKTGRRV